MELTAAYIWSQILTVVEYGLLGWSYQAKNRKLVVILDIFSMLAGIFVFLLLGADLGMGMSIVILLANFYYLWQEHQKKLRTRRYWWDYLMLFVILVVIGVITWLTYDGWLSLLSVAATVFYEISIWQKSTRVYKFLGIPVAFSWMVYNGFVGSPVGVIMEAGMFVSSIVGYVREYYAAKMKEMRRRGARKAAKAKGKARKKK